MKNTGSTWEGYVNAFDQAPGSQGFPGFSPSDTIHAKRHSFSAYVDAELNVTKKWLVDAAIRFENYSDFGSLVTYKFATRYKIASNFNIRASASTGFRAPSLQQINFSNTLTSFSGGALVQSRIARNGDAITKSAGIPDLKEETSLNASLGFAWKHRGLLLEEMERLEDALASLKRAAAVAPADANIHLLLGNLQARLGRA